MAIAVFYDDRQAGHAPAFFLVRGHQQVSP